MLTYSCSGYIGTLNNVTQEIEYQCGDCGSGFTLKFNESLGKNIYSQYIVSLPEESNKAKKENEQLRKELEKAKFDLEETKKDLTKATEAYNKVSFNLARTKKELIDLCTLMDARGEMYNHDFVIHNVSISFGAKDPKKYITDVVRKYSEWGD
jgi:regulator of replication initiation timing